MRKSTPIDRHDSNRIGFAQKTCRGGYSRAIEQQKKSCIPMNTRYKDNTFLQQKQLIFQTKIHGNRT